MATERRYGDPCGIARALDRIGERWALLVIRELLLGPLRFTDLRAGLPQASPNVLSQRLRELESAGVVTRRTLPPPAASTVYELTPWGCELKPVILGLARWGRQATPLPDGELGATSLLIALETAFDAAAVSPGLRAQIVVELDGTPFTLTASRHGLVARRGTLAGAVAATLRSTPATLRAVAFGRRSLAAAERAGELTISGDHAAVARLLAGITTGPAAPPAPR